MSTRPGAVRSRRGVTRMAGVVVAVVIVVGAVAAGYVYLQTQGGSQSSGGLEFLSGVFDVVASPNGTQTSVSILLFVQNVAAKPITSLTASVAGIPQIQFDGGFGRSINSSRPLYPNEVTHNLPPPGGVGLVYHPGVVFTNGTQYSITFSATLSDGSESQLTQSFVMKGQDTFFTPGGYLSPATCSVAATRNDTYHFKTIAYSVDNSSKATWEVTVGVGMRSPAASITLGVNNGTLWFPLDYNGGPVSPANPVPVGTNVTQTFTWTAALGHTSTRSVEWVGTCAEENAITSIAVHA